MTDHATSPTVESHDTATATDHVRRWLRVALALVGLVLLAEPAAAQSAGSTLCRTAMAQTIQNVFALIQFGGPLLGGVLAPGATVAVPIVRRADWKKEMKGIRNQGLLWGVIVAPLGSQIVAFLLNNVVAGGASCGF